MKKLVIYLLIFTMAFSLTACAATNKPITDLETFKAQVLDDWCKHSNYTYEVQYLYFYYYGTDNGYHIIFFNVTGGDQVCDMHSERIAGYTFKCMNSSRQLKAYKDGEFIDLRMAYLNGLISEEAIAKAAELHNEKYNNIDEIDE